MVAKDSKDSVIYLKIPSNDEGEDSGNSYWNVRESKLWFWTLLFGTACNYAVRSSTPLVAHRPNIISKGGYLADRFGPEKVILLSSIIYGLLMFLVPIYFYGCLIMLDSISFISSEMCILVETHIVFYGKMSSGSSFGTLLRDVWLSITDLLWVLLRNFMSQELLFLDSALDRNYHQLSMTFHGSFTFEVPSLWYVTISIILKYEIKGRSLHLLVQDGFAMRKKPMGIGILPYISKVKISSTNIMGALVKSWGANNIYNTESTRICHVNCNAML
ncbi:SLC17A9 [Lepeophtheirus salmonis]|uniref:SLC17A9 n=1 Tax=Lepeophtheirus salmonis TaxID=72036 RepID=A0A7R8H5A7_LEPSM|nr:SLC17A9 [Lepeophtheirus salmonis]CAF2860593.1 SLC17A9 [Lepeophtheirus salmonis]